MGNSILLQKLENEYNVDIESLIGEIKRYLPIFHEQKFRKALLFAARAHEGQLRKSGHPYIIHPFETVKILKSLHVDEDTLIAALLHDVPEDTEKTIEDVEAKFGKKIAFLVQGITKLSKVHYKHDMQTRQVESLKKLFIHTAKDPRIIIIKLADRLHNMRTLNSISKPEKKSRIAKETLEIFVPIANLLGIEELKAELEDLCFKYLYPEDYELLSERIKASRYKNEKILDRTIKTLNKELTSHLINYSVYGRMKNLYHIYKRTEGEMNSFQEYDNMIALRIIVGSKEECYQTLGIVHTFFKPKPGKFRDYISLPKKNGYQSLHTTVFGLEGVTSEIQIRTHQMHLEAKYGIAAQYFEKAQKTPHLEEDVRANWAAKILQTQKVEQQQGMETNFLENLKDDILHDRIFVFTPKGESIDLPKDATCIDFAYEIHTEVGHRAIKAEVNNQIVPVTTKLKDNDTVNIVTSDIAKGPSRSWLAFVKTHSARNKILEYFKKVSKEKNLNTGRRLLQKELDWAGLGMVQDISQKKIRAYCHNKKDCKSINDLLLKIGEGSVSPLNFINELYPQRDVPKSRALRFLKRKLFNSDRKDYTLVTLKIVSRDAVGQLKKILYELAEQKLNALSTRAYISSWTGDFICKTTICVENYSRISQICEAMEHIDGVKRVSRQFLKKKLYFILGIALTFIIWAAHPYILHFITTDLAPEINPILAGFILYSGIFMLFMMVFLLKRLTQRSFPELRETSVFWAMTFLLSTFAIITLFAEIYFFELSFNWVLILGLILLILAYLTSEYLDYKKRT